eukprot:jgi/Mesvir1/8065/Mv10517-RA.1
MRSRLGAFACTLASRCGSREYSSKTVTVVLKENMIDLGPKGTVIQASPGYMRNYLYPRKLAVYGTPTNLELGKKWSEAPDPTFAALVKDARESRLRERASQEINHVASRLEKGAVKLRRYSKEDTLHEPVTAADVVEGIRKQLQIEVDPRAVQLAESITKLGNYKVPLHFPGLEMKLALKVQKRW